MAKVQFNCRVSEETVEAINRERDRLSKEEDRPVSQAEVLERIVPTHSFIRFRDILEPIVYGWRRGDEYLYIGYSKNGLRRVCNADHHVVGKAEAVGRDDALDVWVCAGIEEAQSLEQELIRSKSPKHNTVGIACTNPPEKPRLPQTAEEYEALVERAVSRSIVRNAAIAEMLERVGDQRLSEIVRRVVAERSGNAGETERTKPNIDKRQKNAHCKHCGHRFAGSKYATICGDCKGEGHTLSPSECPRCNEASSL